MDVCFSSARLAAVCSSELLMANAWGVETGRLIRRRLLDLCAISVEALERLPDVAVHSAENGQTTITFGEVVVSGLISAGDRGADPHQLLIQSIEIETNQRR
jgi:hypothetical protein